MKLAAKYYLYHLRNSLLMVFLFVNVALVLGLSLVLGILFGPISNFDGKGEYIIPGFEVIFIFFTLVSGMVSFQESFRFFQQNSVSRKSQFGGWTFSLLALSAAEAILAILSSRFFGLYFRYDGMFGKLYRPLQASTNGALFLAQEFLWVCMICLFMGWLGFAITLLYYRLSKMGKILVSVLVLGTLLILLPVADQYLLQGAYSWLLKQLAMLMTGYLSGGIYPMVPVVSALAGSAILAVLSWLMLRRAEVRS